MNKQNFGRKKNDKWLGRIIECENERMLLQMLLVLFYFLFSCVFTIHLSVAQKHSKNSINAFQSECSVNIFQTWSSRCWTTLTAYYSRRHNTTFLHFLWCLLKSCIISKTKHTFERWDKCVNYFIVEYILKKFLLVLLNQREK